METPEMTECQIEERSDITQWRGEPMLEKEFTSTNDWPPDLILSEHDRTITPLDR